MPTYLIGLIILLTRQGGDFIAESLRKNHSGHNFQVMMVVR